MWRQSCPSSHTCSFQHLLLLLLRLVGDRIDLCTRSIPSLCSRVVFWTPPSTFTPRRPRRSWMIRRSSNCLTQHYDHHNHLCLRVVISLSIWLLLSNATTRVAIVRARAHTQLKHFRSVSIIIFVAKAIITTPEDRKVSVASRI